MNEPQVGDVYISRNGMKGEVQEINGVKKIVVRNFSGRIVQTIAMDKIEISKFKKETK